MVRIKRTFPWWLTVILAAVIYWMLKYGVALVQASHPLLADLAAFTPALAPLAAIGLLLLAAKQLYDGEGAESDLGEEDSDHG